MEVWWYRAYFVQLLKIGRFLFCGKEMMNMESDRRWNDLKIIFSYLLGGTYHEKTI